MTKKKLQSSLRNNYVQITIRDIYIGFYLDILGLRFKLDTTFIYVFNE